MFDPVKEVPNLELCKKLKELGFPQEEGGFWWVLFENSNDYELCYWDEEHIRWDSKGKYVLIGGCDCCSEHLKIVDKIKAPTVRELGEYLPDKVGYIFYLICEKRKKLWIIEYYDGNDPENFLEYSIDSSETNVRTQMLIWLVENDYVKFNK